MIARKCRCKTWEQHLDSDKCQVEYDFNELFDSYDEWHQEFSDKWQIEYDPEEYFLVPEKEERSSERSPQELAIARGDLFFVKNHPHLLRAMSANLNDTEDEILCQLLFDEKSPEEIAKNFGMKKLAILRRIAMATYKIQYYFGLAPREPSSLVVIPSEKTTRDGFLPHAA
jgi:hypothetical protein